MLYTIAMGQNQFLLVVKFTAFETANIRILSPILRMDVRDHNYLGHCLEFADFFVFAVVKHWLLQQRETNSGFVFIIGLFAVLLGKIASVA